MPTETNPNSTNCSGTQDDAEEAFSPEVMAKLEEAEMRVQNVPAAKLLWDRLLTEPERESLGGDFEACYEKYKGSIGIWRHARNTSKPRAIIQIACGIDLLSEPDYRWLHREISMVDPMSDDEDPGVRVELARKSHLLLVVRGNTTHRVYWRGNLIEADWSGNPKVLNLIWQLGARAKHREPVSWDDVDRNSQKTIVHQRARLKKMIPEALDAVIQPGANPGSYKLDLPPEQIHLMQLEPDDWLLKAD